MEMSDMEQRSASVASSIASGVAGRPRGGAARSAVTLKAVQAAAAKVAPLPAPDMRLDGKQLENMTLSDALSGVIRMLSHWTISYYYIILCYVYITFVGGSCAAWSLAWGWHFRLPYVSIATVLPDVLG